MLTKIRGWLSENRCRNLYLVGLSLFAAGLPLSKTAMSLALGLLGIHWLISGGWRWFPGVRSQLGIAFYLFLLISFIHLAGLWNTNDLTYAGKDLRIKLPLLLLPVFMVSAPEMSRSQISAVLKVFIGSVTVGTLFTFVLWISNNPLDPRDLVPYNSHIRFSMMVCIAMFVAAFKMIEESNTRFEKTGWTILVFWLFGSVLLLESLTGITALALGLFAALLWVIFNRKISGHFRLLALGGLTLLVAGSGWMALRIQKEFVPEVDQIAQNLDQYTRQGNPYFHDHTSLLNENGNLVWIYVAEEEMRESWNRRSKMPFDHQLETGYETGDVLLRFLSSKGLRKDAQGVESLTDDEIRMVEAGLTNYKYSRFSWLRKRFDQLKWEYWNYLAQGDPKGHSVLQRIELWRVGLDLASENLLTGVGTGDVKSDFANHMVVCNSSLAGTPLRAHNQYLTILITFGIPGLILFLIALAGPLYFRYKKLTLWFIITLIILYFSLAAEDTLETQVGASLFSFLFAFQMFQPIKTNPNEENQPMVTKNLPVVDATSVSGIYHW